MSSKWEGRISSNSFLAPSASITVAHRCNLWAAILGTVLPKPSSLETWGSDPTIFYSCSHYHFWCLRFSLNHLTVRSATKRISPSEFQFNFSHPNFRDRRISWVNCYVIFQRWLAPSLLPHCLNPISLFHLTIWILLNPKSIYDFNFWLGLALLTIDLIAYCLSAHFDFFTFIVNPSVLSDRTLPWKNNPYISV